ncbi:hypothetical protein GCM10028820_20970 [Tessaracoccus terricola]
MLKRKPLLRAAALLAVPALVATTIITGPLAASAIDVGDDRHGTTAIAPDRVTPEVPVEANGTTLGAITGVTTDGGSATLTAANGKYRVTFLDETTFRVEATRTEFADPANTPQNDPERTANIIVGTDDFDGATVTATDGETIVVSAGGASVEVEKATGKMTAKNADGDVIWAESAPLSFGGNSTTQHLAMGADEQVLGGGMQNGRSIHTDASINIAANFDWDDDGYPNAVPYYMTSGGYGVLRNTFAPGTYDFGEGTTTHREQRFDAYYFAGNYKESLDGYTKLTGRPHMPPVYALEYGDADCYNRSSPTYQGAPQEGKNRTPEALEVALDFVENDMPAGWMLVNDGYGCEYVELPETVDNIEEQTGLKTGLWTQRSLTEQPYEIGEAGIRLRKLDVAWVGYGYRMALTGCEAAYNGFEDNSDARGTALLVEGWAGAQRCGMVWTGDHSGNLDAVRWQVSALMGSGNSGQPFATGDVDGIFGGSPESYVRDLQWKAFAPALYSMSGWASVDKRPWLYGEEATEINRYYLQLRQQLMPYIYSLSHNAHATGTPVMRSLALEYPEDLGSYSVEANNQFLLGTDYLVAPVFTSTSVRSGIYLPAGDDWVDFWTGRVHEGGQVLNGHPAPLDKLPIFVRAGAVVPQGIIARNASLVAEDSAITLDVYPSGESSYDLYEDDKVTRAYREGEHSSQTVSVSAPEEGAGDVTVTIGERVGSYEGMADSRPYTVAAHTHSEPARVTVDGTETTDWTFDAATGVVTVQVGQVASGTSAVVVLEDSSAIGGKDPDAMAATLVGAMPDRVYRGEETSIEVTFANTGDAAKTGIDVDVELPEGWELVSASDVPTTIEGGDSVTQTLVVRPGADAVAGAISMQVTATYVDASGDARTLLTFVETELTYGSLADAFNAVSITTVENAALGNFDGGGATFADEQLQELGIVAGEEFTVDTGDAPVTYTWDAVADEANSVAVSGQTVALSGQGTHLAIVGSSASAAGVTGEFTINYTDGTTSTGGAGFPNWLYQAQHGMLGSTIAITTKGRNNVGGYEYPNGSYQMYQSLVTLNPAKTVESVTLPGESTLKLFAWTIVENEMPEVPTEDVYASDWPWLSATNGYGTIGLDVDNLDPGMTQEDGTPLESNYIDPETGENRVYEKGLGVHANGRITYYLGGQCSAFTAEVGMENGFAGPVIFTVTADGADRYQSRTFVPDMDPESVSVDLTGVQFVDLAIRYPSSAAGAHGIWGDALFHCGESTDPTEEPTVTPDPSEEPTVTPDPSEEPTVTPDPSEEPTVTPDPSEEPTVTPDPTEEPTATIPPKGDLYSTPGLHVVNGRHWWTECEDYSQTQRCTTRIWATSVKETGGTFANVSGWVFNNLTYLPLMTRAQWAGNPLGVTGEWTADDGRKWRTECDTAVSGRNGCRTTAHSQVLQQVRHADGTISYEWQWKWVVNNIVRFK